MNTKRLLIVICLFFLWNTISVCKNLNVESGHFEGDGIKRVFKSDICVYGASASGIFAAVAAAREGYSVVIIEPTHTIGGLLASGFRMQQDVPDPQHLGGMTRDFYEKDIALHKGIHAQTLRHYQGAGEDNIELLQSYIDKYTELITIITGHRLSDVATSGKEIKNAIFEYAPPDKNGVPIPVRASDNLTKVEAGIFIDASYEGDLMAHSGVSYRIGRESKSKYDESLAGVVVSRKFPRIDPYKVKGDPESGLLSPIQEGPIGEEGDSSRFFMGWNFKLAWETNPSEEYPGVTIKPLENKKEDVLKLLDRYVDAGYELTWPHGNFDRNELVTGAIPGMQVEYPDGDWEKRSEIWQSYIDHVKTLTEFTDKDIRLLSNYREETNGWPFLYMRGGRRMIGEYVMTQHDIQLQTDVPNPIGMGYYKIDIYPTRLVVNDEGIIVQEGDVFVLASPGPYQIPYGAIIPKNDEIKNLLVPLCMSASHVAYSSIRMEATYMVMGEAAGVAASIALKSNKSLQDIDRNKLRSTLMKYGQNLAWDGTGFYTKGLWRSNIFGDGSEETGRWETHPDEYSKHPVDELWKK